MLAITIAQTANMTNYGFCIYFTIKSIQHGESTAQVARKKNQSLVSVLCLSYRVAGGLHSTIHEYGDRHDAVLLGTHRRYRSVGNISSV